VQLAALLAVLKVPAAHAVQLRSLMAVPSLATKVPARQIVFATHWVAGLASWSQVPAVHATWALLPPGQYCPGTQAVQALPLCTVPAGQVVATGRHCDWLSPFVVCPGGQATQARSAVVDGVFATYVPAGQLLPGVQLAALLLVLNWPLAQPVQVRSVVVSPSPET
jgi:hypothetical protein